MRTDSLPEMKTRTNLPSPTAIAHELACLRQYGSVLYVAAHPDDENTELLAYLALGRKYRSAYLSLTRGDGGQNVLGADLGAKLGVARTQELLAARRIDGGQQFFSRAVDYGFSKSYLETLSVWNRDEVVADIVRVIREFRPDVVITRFSPSPGGTHGHHTTATVLTLEALKQCGNPQAYPEQRLSAWLPKRVLWNASTFQKDKITSEPVLKIDISGKDSVSDKTFKELARASRAMHKTQGFDQFRFPGDDSDERSESFQLLAGEPAVKDIMDGVNTAWSRVEGGGAVEKSLDEVIQKFDQSNPAASLPALLKLRSIINELPSKDSVVAEKQALLDHIIMDCAALHVETSLPEAEVVPGEMLKLHIAVTSRAILPAGTTLKWIGVRFPRLNSESPAGFALSANKIRSLDFTETLPKITPLTQPYWLEREPGVGMFHVDDASLIGKSENPPAFSVELVFEIGGQRLVVPTEPLEISKKENEQALQRSDFPRRMQVIPPVSLRFLEDVALLRPGTKRAVTVEVRAARAKTSGKVSLKVPLPWHVQTADQHFSLAAVGDTARLSFTVAAPDTTGGCQIKALADVNGVQYCNQRQEISYAHLPLQLLQPPATLSAISVDLKTLGGKVGYLPGAGDSLVEGLEQMGYVVKQLDDATLKEADLDGLDAVVLGVRAFNVRPKIGEAMPILLAYVKNGGTVLVQYNRPDKLKANQIAPFDLTISADRVTNEKAQMHFLAPESELLNAPNKITEADFDGWVQERGLYFPNKWDEHFQPVLACNDADEPLRKGCLLVARYGKGHYIYTGLSFFRQLPAAVPGAYRLLANMVSIGKK